MAYYAYKTVRDLLPKHITDAMGECYEGDGNYDGNQWYAAKSYILELLAHRSTLLEALKTARDHLDMASLEISHCKDAAAINSAMLTSTTAQ